MQVLLQVFNGPSRGKRVVLRQGQIVRVGRTEWADFCVPSDAKLADVHFSISSDGPRCRVRDLSNGAGTAVNGKPATDAPLKTGDQIEAGSTKFVVNIEGVGPASMSDTADAVDSADAAVEAPPTAAQFCQKIELSEEATALLTETISPADFVDLLGENRLFADGLLFVAVWLPKATAVAWGCRCVRNIIGEGLSPKDQAALAAAEAWSADPQEELRREAEKAALATRHRGSAGWLALAAFGSGSLAPPGGSELPPPEGYTAQMVAGALLSAGTKGNPAQTPDRYRDFLQQGKELAINNPSH